jgi:ParB family chromosome partitioning protein
MVAPSVPRPRHFGGGPTRLADVVRPREAVAAPAVRVKLDRIDPSPRNPRRHLEVAELAASIEAYGLLQPVVLRQVGVRYELVAGHRRVAAVKLLGEQHPDDARWREIEAVLRQADEDEAYLLTLAENLQRSDLAPREEAAALEVLVRQEGWSVRRVAAAIHRDPAYVSRRLRVFDDPVLAGPVLSNALAVTTAQELLRVDPDRRAAMVEQAIAGGWNAHETRRAVKERCDSQHPDVGDELFLHLRAAGALLASASVGALSEEQRADARRLLRRLGRALRELA